jgi:hypothetical protein
MNDLEHRGNAKQGQRARLPGSFDDTGLQARERAVGFAIMATWVSKSP